MDARTGFTAQDTAVFGPEARAAFAAAYPETPGVIAHNLADHPLLGLDALAALAGALPESSIEYNRGDVPIGIDGKPGGTGVPIEDTIRHIATSNSWAVLKNIEQVPAYRDLLMALLGELRPLIEARTGAMLRPQGFVFISSPDAVTPYHFDPEHNILLQLVGSKVMTQFPAGDGPLRARYAARRLPHRRPARAHLARRPRRGRHALCDPRGRGGDGAGDGPAPRQERARELDLAVDHLAQRLVVRRGRRALLERPDAPLGP